MIHSIFFSTFTPRGTSAQATCWPPAAQLVPLVFEHGEARPVQTISQQKWDTFHSNQ
jgi:hypothetical protein